MYNGQLLDFVRSVFLVSIHVVSLENLLDLLFPNIIKDLLEYDMTNVVFCHRELVHEAFSVGHDHLHVSFDKTIIPGRPDMYTGELLTFVRSRRIVAPTPVSKLGPLWYNACLTPAYHRLIMDLGLI